MEFITANLDNILSAIGAIVSVATAIVAITPSTKDDEILGKIVKVLEKLSLVNKKTHE